MTSKLSNWLPMRISRLRIILIVFAGLLLVLGLRDIGYEQAYRIGMSLSEVQRLTKSQYPVVRLYPADAEPPEADESRRAPTYYIYDERAGLILFFNDGNELIRKKRVKLMGVNMFRLIDSFR